MTPSQLVLSPLDTMRREVLRLAGPRSLLSAREPRVAVMATVAIVTALAACVTAPLFMLAVSPVLLGVPHLLADVRYLVVRPGLHRRRELWPAAAALALVSLTGDVSFGFLAVAWVIRERKLFATAAILAALTTFALGFEAALVLAYVHNAVAVLLWWRWRPRRARAHWLPLALFAAASLAIVAGAFPDFAPGDFDWLGPPRLVLLFAFSQAVHYAIWLRLIPEDDRPGPAVRGFRASFDALRADFALAPLLGFAALALGIAAWGLVDLDAARTGYFRLAMFHGHLEYCALALLLLPKR